MNIMNRIVLNNKIKDVKLMKNRLTYHQKVTDYIKECYKFILSNGYVSNQYQFSKYFLNSNKFYFGKIICEQYAPSLATLFTLIDNIGLISSIDKHSTTAKQLYEQGLSLIKQKLLQ
ncbi:MAG: hypothetical protein KBT19_09005 [Lachnospiraceae bacterium]|nr:hypothetical protein [Candidatus Colinaster equi]